MSVNAIYAPDNKLMETFNYLYNYNWLDRMIEYLDNKKELSYVIDAINNDDPTCIRANCLENHDKNRIAYMTKNTDQLKEWLKFSFALKGHNFIYMGEEYGIKHKPELFEKDPVIWPKEENEIYRLVKELISNKHQPKSNNKICINNNIVIFDNKEYKL